MRKGSERDLYLMLMKKYKVWISKGEEDILIFRRVMSHLITGRRYKTDNLRTLHVFQVRYISM